MTEASAHPDVVEVSPVQRRGMNMGILQACMGAVGYIAFTNGMILLYLNALGVSSQRIVLYLTLPSVLQASLLLPMAYLGDRRGKRGIALLGCCLELVSYVLLMSAGWLANVPREILLLMGILTYGVGTTAYSSTWFALISPIVPEPMRGRFFGRLRMSWQTFSLIFAGVSAAFLDAQSPLWMFQLVLACIVVCSFIRLFFYASIPELEPSAPQASSFFSILLSIIRIERFMSFSAYGFLLYLFTGGVTTLMALVEKKVLDYGDNTIIWLGILNLVGGIVGFYIGGLMVDRWGTKPVFLISHFGFCAMMLLFLARGFVPGTTLFVVAAVNFGFGYVLSCSTIAMTTEMMALMPPANKSVSSSFNMSMVRGGVALSGVLVTCTLDLNILCPQWTLAGCTLSSYDAILLGFAIMVLVMVVTLGLVPSVVGKAQWYPRMPA
ncbi:MAG: MFS transporter [Phycisphaeraceae bacterium]|nr:MFS transporter [Phycisphaeraceae bacterium]